MQQDKGVHAMVSTIGNPFSWGAKNLGAAGRGIDRAVRHAGGDDAEAMPVLREIGLQDIRDALRLGVADFLALRSDVIVACLLYPVVGACLIWMAFHNGILPLAFPLVSGFALVGPVAAIGLYELSRRREAGEPAGWSHVFSVLQAPGFGAIILLSLGMAALLALWLLAAWVLHAVTMGQGAYPGAVEFARQVVTTPGGWAMILIGIPLGFCFAVVALAISVISFPLLVDRDIGLPKAVVTSVRLAQQNPRTILTWGAVVAFGLALGALPLLLGLAVTLPILGHATWHLYRRAVV
jgi:uncharacterized membrane protein